MAAINSIGVIGAGAWGTALANAAARAGRPVRLWARDPALVAALAAARVNERYLPGVSLEEAVAVTPDLAEAAACDAVLLAVPAQASREAAGELSSILARGTPLVTCAKGIERTSSLFMTQVLAEACPRAVPAILSGPSFAVDVAAGLPTAVTLAAEDGALARDLAMALGSGAFRLYHTDDVRGVEIGGAAKNVLAIAAGIVAGRGLGASASAALIARGFAELMRFGRAYGARAETLTGLSGLGDLILTASSTQSRNHAFGLALGRGEAPDGKLAEGALTAQVLVRLARERGIDMPLAEAVDQVVSGTCDINAAIGALLARPQKAES
ncbi:NAD(P)-dependent glycerol-3-phosphate dehydrogenase [Ancylobacter sp. 6x-1]|uniref:Glycerol-3-phosphate dehydrogenase [NAD(P)+] n=1 Tax=Ancylobacter crimeensis TaxID=2579147 RepID=A0ABT0DFG7_9HYPH|nr:NAD(P)H-dependent glycerol-3-phosphate dehydrogenase [Ancylobacter crimeensis]MCK0198482.1 NAD(P)-dependent glycerol-3-phosphate dehydrogenase [Ancylobacter crimeensis]